MYKLIQKNTGIGYKEVLIANMEFVLFFLYHKSVKRRQAVQADGSHQTPARLRAFLLKKGDFGGCRDKGGKK